MIHRIALLLGGVAAAAVLAFSLVRGDRTALSATADDPAVAASSEDPTAAPAREVVDTVYVAAPRKPKVVHVTRRAPTPTARPAARTTRQSTRRHEAEDDHEREHEGGEREGDD